MAALQMDNQQLRVSSKICSIFGRLLPLNSTVFDSNIIVKSLYFFTLVIENDNILYQIYLNTAVA